MAGSYECGMNLRVLLNAKIFVTNIRPVSFSGTTLLHGVSYVGSYGIRKSTILTETLWRN